MSIGFGNHLISFSPEEAFGMAYLFSKLGRFAVRPCLCHLEKRSNLLLLNKESILLTSSTEKLHSYYYIELAFLIGSLNKF